VPIGSDKELECDLLPLGLAASLDGKWTARVNGELAEIVEVDHVNNRAKIRPRDPPGRYQSTGSLTITCFFTTPDGNTTLFVFNRTMRTDGKQHLASALQSLCIDCVSRLRICLCVRMILD